MIQLLLPDHMQPQVLQSKLLKLDPDLRIGIGYDITAVNPMGNSLEFMLGYNFKLKTNKAISKYKNHRFLKM